jgi:hypothetical protein
MYGTFTGFHRCFTTDELIDNENPQDFKDNYIGRIVVSTEKIATDLKSIDNDQWNIKYDKDGITIEDALANLARAYPSHSNFVANIVVVA